MEKTTEEEVDLRIGAENVSFLANCFDNSFVLQNSLNCVKDYVAQLDNVVSLPSQRKSINGNKRNSLTCNLSINKKSQLEENTQIFKKKLRNWGLPYEITAKYEERGINDMFDWQVDCLSNSKVLLDCCNLIYSAPTSAGKTLVAEILTIKTIIERQKKVIIILPFVSIVREKMFYLQDILSSSGIRVEGFMGSQSPPGGLQAVHLAICTIEKANSLVNKLIDEDNISDLGAVIVDELHLLGDPHRGYILELLLTKIKYLSYKFNEIKIQIVGMSATLPNLETLSNWLNAELFVTDFRPIPLEEFCLIGRKYYDKSGKYVSSIDTSSNSLLGGDCVLSLCMETIKEGCSVLIFCMTKNRCESLAQTIASSFYKLGCSKSNDGITLRDQLNTEKITEVLEQLHNCPVGLDQVLKNIISFGVAYHHAGLTFDERDIIEGAFKSGGIRVLIATSTLSSGVNLPARKVIIRTPVFQRQPINILTYKQMVGRAGRMGKDLKGESILICTQSEQKIGLDLMMGNLDPVISCIDCEDKFMRAILEMIASQSVCTKIEMEMYSKSTLLFTQQSGSSQNLLLENTIKQLITFELVRVQVESEESNYVATSLGKACLASSMAPNDGISLFCELQRARQCLVLETDLHLIYLVTPYSVSNQWNDIDWIHLLTLWESSTMAMKRVGELVGVQESFIVRSLRGVNKCSNSQNKLNIHKRFYTALALQDLVNEVPLSDVAKKFQCSRGFLQGLQQASATFAGMVTAFCHQLGWKNMEMLISQFQDRLQFGIHSELLELMKLTSLNGVRARTLFNAGFETIASVASADVNVIENTLLKTVPFQSEKEREGDDDADLRKRNKMRNIWITGCCGMTAKEAAESLILEARNYLQLEIGVSDIKWQKSININTTVKESSCYDTQSKSKDEQEFQIQILNKSNKTDIINVEEISSEPCEAKNNSDLNSLKFYNKSIKHNDEVKDDVNDESKYENTIIQPEIENVLAKDNFKQDNQKTRNSLASEKSGKRNDSIKDDILWDSLVLSESVLGNITRTRSTVINESPNITFEESTDSSNYINKAINFNNSIKDISLFSSDDNSSLFEESLPLEAISDNVNDNKLEKSDNFDTNMPDGTINSNTILNAFKSSIIDIDEDEDIKLVYEDENKNYEHNVDVLAPQENVKVSTLSSVDTNFKSPLKRNADTLKFPSEFPGKKMKQMNVHEKVMANNMIICSQSDKFTLKLDKYEMKCFILKGNNIIENLYKLEHMSNISLLLDINFGHKTVNLIGDKIFKGNKILSKTCDIKNSNDVFVKGVIFCFNQNICVYCNWSSLAECSSVNSILIRFFRNARFKLIMSSLKFNFVQIKKWLSQDLLSKCLDISLAEWLLNCEDKISSLIDMTKKYCDIDVSNVEMFVDDKKCSYKSLDSIQNLCLKAWCIALVAEKQKPLLDQYYFLNKILDVETQISKILAKCEYNGVTVDKKLASQLLLDVKNSQDILQQKAYKICGSHFNLNSSKDVAKVLGLYKGRKVSTKKSVLSAHNSPASSIVIYWRKLNSILTKTLYPLTEQATVSSADDRIRPSYTVYTSTGRVSMHEPNLQNVPRTFAVPVKYLTLKENELNDDLIEFNCRNIFRAASGFTLVSADYCQLEMRILTHYCRDVVLTRTMCSGVDVFTCIAATWGGVPEDQVDDDLRQKAKQLCYGILYGMGNKTLAQHLDVTEVEAAVFMDTFYKTYPAIRVFTQKVLEDCRRNGYVETLMKRRRYLPDINSTIVSKRCAAERQAINTTIQGSAADIAKAAMCGVDARTGADAHPPRLILQMHDELIYEVPECSKLTFPLLLREVMEDTLRLNVPLPVKVRSGDTWGSLVMMNL